MPPRCAPTLKPMPNDRAPSRTSVVVLKTSQIEAGPTTSMNERSKGRSDAVGPFFARASYFRSTETRRPPSTVKHDPVRVELDDADFLRAAGAHRAISPAWRSINEEIDLAHHVTHLAGLHSKCRCNRDLPNSEAPRRGPDFEGWRHLVRCKADHRPCAIDQRIASCMHGEFLDNAIKDSRVRA